MWRNTSRRGATTIRWECFWTVRRELINLGASSHPCSKPGSENISQHSPPEPQYRFDKHLVQQRSHGVEHYFTAFVKSCFPGARSETTSGVRWFAERLRFRSCTRV